MTRPIRPWVVPALLLGGFAATGCGLPPCFEGELRIELIELKATDVSCPFEGWPVGTELTIESVRNLDNIEDDCRVQRARYVEHPDGTIGRQVSTKSEVTESYVEVAVIEPFSFAEQGCSITAYSRLYFSRRYNDLESALDGQAEGDQEAFLFKNGFSASGEDCAQVQEAMEGETDCSTWHSVRVSKP